MHESGLLAVTLMGMGLANMKGVDDGRSCTSRENLSVLLISGLFILLAARLDIRFPTRPGPGGAAGAAADPVRRPAAERGAVDLGFAAELARARPAQLDRPRGIVPGGAAGATLTFLVIIGTVVLQSATARPWRAC